MERLLKAGEMAEFLGLSVAKVYSLCDTGQLRYVEIPGLVPSESRRKCMRFEESAIDEFLSNFTRSARPRTDESSPRRGKRASPSERTAPEGYRIEAGILIPNIIDGYLKEQAERKRIREEKRKEKEEANRSDLAKKVRDQKS